MLAYFYGAFDIGGAWWHIPHIASLTGQEPTPQLFGGSADLWAAGLARSPHEMFSTGYAPLLGLVAKALPSLYLALFLHVILPPTLGRGRVFGWGLLGVVVLSGWVVSGRVAPPTLSVNLWNSLHVSAGEKVSYDIQPGADWREKLLRLPTDASLSLYLGLAKGQAEVHLYADGQQIPLPSAQFAPSHGIVYDLSPEARQLLASKSAPWQIRITANTHLTLRGWQRSDLKDRQIQPPLPVLPLLEMRAYAADGGLLLAGF